jgi:hypothetical protein
MARKTFDVQEFRMYVNSVLSCDNVPSQVKEGFIGALDHVLHQSGNYRGFNYLQPYDENDPEYGITQDEETGYYFNGKKALKRRYN